MRHVILWSESVVLFLYVSVDDVARKTLRKRVGDIWTRSRCCCVCIEVVWSIFNIFDRARIRTSISMSSSFLTSFWSTSVIVILISSTTSLSWISATGSDYSQLRQGTNYTRYFNTSIWRNADAYLPRSRYTVGIWKILSYIDSRIVFLLIDTWIRNWVRTFFMKPFCRTISSANVSGVTHIECAWISRRGRLFWVSEIRMRAVELYIWWKVCNWKWVINRTVTWISDRSDICAKDLWWYCALQ